VLTHWRYAEKACVLAVLQVWIRKMLGSNLDGDTGYPDGVFSWFSAVHPGKCWDSTSIGPRQLPTKSIPIRESSCHSKSRYWPHRKINYRNDVDGFFWFGFYTPHIFYFILFCFCAVKQSIWCPGYYWPDVFVLSPLFVCFISRRDPSHFPSARVLTAWQCFCCVEVNAGSRFSPKSSW
jgi:hypothetical protein